MYNEYTKIGHSNYWHEKRAAARTTIALYTLAAMLTAAIIYKLW